MQWINCLLKDFLEEVRTKLIEGDVVEDLPLLLLEGHDTHALYQGVRKIRERAIYIQTYPGVSDSRGAYIRAELITQEGALFMYAGYADKCDAGEESPYIGLPPKAFVKTIFDMRKVPYDADVVVRDLLEKCPELR